MTDILPSSPRPKSRFGLQRIFSFPVAISSLLSVLAVLTVRGRFDDPDMWWHLKMGQIISATHRIPTNDIFAYTTNHQAIIPQEWLAEVAIYSAYAWAGYFGLMLWMCSLASLLLIAGYLLCWFYSGNAKVAFAGAMIIWFFATIGFAIRPQMISFILMMAELLLIHAGRREVHAGFWGSPSCSCSGSTATRLSFSASWWRAYISLALSLSLRWAPSYRIAGTGAGSGCSSGR